MPRHAAAPSFTAFFRKKLLPVLQEFESTRRRRLCFLGVTFGLLTWAVLWVTSAVFPWLRPAAVLGLFFSFSAAALGVLMRWGNPNYFYVSRRRRGLGRIIAFFLPFRAVRWAAESILVTDGGLFSNGMRRRRFSRQVVGPVAGTAFPGLIHRTEYVSQGDFIESGLFSPDILHYAGTDYFTGGTARMQLAFSWLDAEYQAGGMRDGSGRRQFSGWFFAVDFRRRFAGTALILPDIAEKNLGWLGRSLQQFGTPAGKQLIHLEDSEFEKHFKVLADSQIDSRRILTPSFMQLLCVMRRHLRADFALSFSGRSMFAAFPGTGKYFTGMPLRSFTDPAYTRHLFYAVRTVRELAEEMLRSRQVWEREIGEAVIQVQLPAAGR